jgi:DNA-binding SARP family transcriptional activator/transcriptional regulator with XRE-family HTH domain
VITFRILGPIRLYQDERSVDLGRAKIRGLLGILLLSANTPVPIDSIVDRLWDNPNELGNGGVKGREPPPDPPRTLQGYVSRLRRILEQTQAPVELLREQRRYRLQLDRRLIDYYRFRELAAVGRRAFRARDHSAAASVLSESVTLWQGQPLADLNSSWAQHIADDLARQDLLPAYHSLFSSQLALGQAEHVLEQLRPLIVSYETDLTLIELQMRALADVNGPSSVVSYFHGLREKLPEVFGIDPTERLLKEAAVPRHPRPLDPEAGPLAAFALELRALRHRMGPTAPTIDQISAKERVPRSTLYAALSGTRAPTEDVLAALVRAWGGDPAEWSAKRADVVQAIGLRRLQEAKVGSIRATPPRSLSQNGVNHHGRRVRPEREEQQLPQTIELIESFARKLRNARVEAGITQNLLARRIGVSNASLSDIERGIRVPSWEIVERILQELLTEDEFRTSAADWAGQLQRAQAARRR